MLSQGATRHDAFGALQNLEKNGCATDRFFAQHGPRSSAHSLPETVLSSHTLETS